MKDRPDVEPWARAPRDVRDFLLKIGGKNPFGEPVFRLSIAEGTKKQAGAEWYRWRDGAPKKMRGALLVDEEGRTVSPPVEKPVSITAEVRWVRKYPTLRGWILEEWHPAHKFGSPEEWAAQKVPDHPEICSLGPYPTEGRYMLAMPYGFQQPDAKHVHDVRFQTPGVPSLSVLQTAVQYVESCRDYWNNLTAENRRRVMDDADLAQSALHEKYEIDRAIMLGRETLQIVQSTSLEAGRVREQWAREAGLKLGHVGA